MTGSNSSTCHRWNRVNGNLWWIWRLGIIFRTDKNRASTFFTLADFLPGALLWSQLPCPAVRSWLICQGGTESSVLYSCSQLQVLGFTHQGSKHSLAFLPMQLPDPLDLPPLPESLQQMASPSTFFQDSFLTGTLHFDTNFSFKNAKPQIFPTSVIYVLKHNMSVLLGGFASYLFINVSVFVWPICNQN